MVKRWSIDSISAEAFDICSQGEDLESCGFSLVTCWKILVILLDCDPGTRMEGLVVPVRTDVRASPSSVVTEFPDGVSLDSYWEFVEPQSSSFFRQRSFVWADSQEEMSYEGTPVKAPPPSRRRMMPPTPQQSSYLSIEEMQWQTEVEA